MFSLWIPHKESEKVKDKSESLTQASGNMDLSFTDMDKTTRETDMGGNPII